MKNLILLLISFSLLFTFACGNDEAEPVTEQEEDMISAAEETAFQSSDAFKQQIEGVLEPYFLLSAALVDADAELAAEHSMILEQQLQEVDAAELDETARQFYAEIYGIVSNRAANIQQESDIEAQRYQFEYLSEAMIETVERFGPLTYDVYVQRCPMVRDGSADWLSRSSEILNPYHGDRMLRCGSVVREL